MTLRHNVLLSTSEIPSLPTPKTPIFLRSAWFQLFEKHIAYPPCSNQILNIKSTTSNDSYYLPLTITPPAKGKPHAKRIQSMCNYYSPFYAFAELGFQSQSVIHQVTLASQDFFKEFDLVDLFPLYPADAEAWKLGLSNIGFKTFIYDYSTNWYHERIEGLEHFWSLRPRRLINTINRKKKKIAQAGDFRLEVIRPKTLIELNHALAEYHNIYYNSWKKIEPYPSFIDSILTKAWLSDELRIGIAYHQNRPVAAQIWLLFNDTAYIFKLAQRNDYKKMSIGTILTARIFEELIVRDNVKYIDFLTGNDAFKKDWMSHKRPLLGIVACNPKTLHGRLNAILNKISASRKHMQTHFNK